MLSLCESNAVLFVHPGQSIVGFLDRKHLSCVLLDTPPSAPKLSRLLDHASFGGPRTFNVLPTSLTIQELAEIGSIIFAKQYFDSFQLLPVAGRYVHFDVDLFAELVRDRALECSAKERTDTCGGKKLKGEGDALSSPLSMAVFEDLEHRRPYIVFGVKPRDWSRRRKRGFPDKTTVWLELHAEQRVWLAGKIVIVDASVDIGRRQTDLL